MPNFETFTQKGAATGVGPLVSIQKGGVFSLNAAAYRLLGQPSHVEFVFDRQERIMGLRPATGEADHTYAVRKQGVVDSYLISGRAFCKHAGIPTDRGARYRAEMMGDVLAVDLNAAPMTTTKPSAKKPTRATEASPRGAH